MFADEADRTVFAVAIATVAVYVLVMVGATASIVDTVAACTGWPACGSLTAALADPRIFVAWGHRLLAAITGVVVGWAALNAWKSGSRAVRVGVLLTLVLYPIQIAIGAVLALRGPSPVLQSTHLLVAMAIFSTLVIVLALVAREAFAGPTIPPASEPSNSRPSTSVGHTSDPTTGLARIRSTVTAYLRLTKPRLMWLLCLVAGAGMALAAGPSLTVRTATATLTGGVLAIGASGTFNHVLERDLDRRMARTADRPIATEQVGVNHAIVFGVVLGVAAVAVFATINVLAAALGIAAITFYSVVYTLLLKPNTVQNTVIGGIAGAFPALIGAAAATNTIGASALLLGLVIFLWTPAHFYNLALLYKEDYERGGVPMFPVVRGEAATRTHILGWLAATLLAVAGLAAVAGLGPVYAGAAVAFGTLFLIAVVDLHRRPSRRTAWRSFHASNAFLGATLLAVVVDSLVI